MPYERDQFLFHYTTREAAFTHILPERRLRFSRYMDMRDPLENKHWRILAGGWGTPTEDEERRQMLGYFQFDNIAAQIREQSFLLSMTEDAPPDRDEEHPFFHGWARARMWEQYAEKHFGVCLVFDRVKLTEAVVSSLRRQGFAPPHHRSVNYEGHGMHKPMPDLNSLAEGVTQAQVTAYIEENHERLFFHKVRDWETEYEYRFSTTSSDKNQLFVDYGDSLVGVVVGEKFPDWERPAAIAACSKAGARPERLDWTMGAPVLVELRPLDSRRDEIRENIQVTTQDSSLPPVDDPGSP